MLQAPESGPVRVAVTEADAARAAAEEELTATLIGEVRRFFRSEVDSYAIDHAGRIPPKVIEGAAALGLFGLTIPEEFGGAGLSMRTSCTLVEEMATVDRSTAIMIGLHGGLGTRGLVEFGTKEAQAEFLPELASGKRVASFAATEAGAGSDLTAIRTTGRPVPGGLEVDGEKSYVTNGRFAGLFTILARTPQVGGERAHCVVCIPAESSGIEIGEEEEKLGIKGSSTVTVRFDKVFVPEKYIIGTPGQGMHHAHRILTWGRTLMAAGCVGTGRAALDRSVEHVTTRRQFHQPIGDFGATRTHIANMAARLYAMRALVQWVAAIEARGESIEIPSGAAKVFCSEGAFELSDRALQLHGALGFIEPIGVARLLRDCRITRIFEGANDVLLVRLGTARVAIREAARSTTGNGGNGHGGHSDATKALDTLRERIDREVAAVRAKYGVSAVRKQLILQCIAQADIADKAASAALDRARRSGTSDDLELAEHATDLLAAEGGAALDQLARAEAIEARSQHLSDRLYGRAPNTIS